MIFRKKATALLVILFIYNFIVNSYYRPFIYKNNINDFGFADVGNNFIFIPSIYLLFFLFRNKFFFSKYKDIIFHLLFLSFIEFLSAFIPHLGTYDFKDICALAFGSIFILLFMKFCMTNEN